MFDKILKFVSDNSDFAWGILTWWAVTNYVASRLGSDQYGWVGLAAGFLVFFAIRWHRSKN